MARSLYRLYNSISRKSDYIFLALSWIAGLFSGAGLFRYSGSTLLSLMPSAALSRLSIVDSLLSLLLPFLFSALAVYISCTGLLYPICFAKALSFGYISCGVFAAFPGSGWLVHGLLMFSNQICVILLFLYWQRHISGFRRFYMGSFIVYMVVICAAAYTDAVYIAPLLNRIMTL